MRTRHAIPLGLALILLNSWYSEARAQIRFGVQLSSGVITAQMTQYKSSVGARVLLGSSHCRLSILADYSTGHITDDYYHSHEDVYEPLVLTVLLIHTNEDFLRPPRGRGRGVVAWHAGLGVQFLSRKANEYWGRDAALIWAASVAIGCRIFLGEFPVTPFLESSFNFSAYRTLVLAGGVYF